VVESFVSAVPTLARVTPINLTYKKATAQLRMRSARHWIYFDTLTNASMMHDIVDLVLVYAVLRLGGDIFKYPLRVFAGEYSVVQADIFVLFVFVNSCVA
jgi:hypothetical protein